MKNSTLLLACLSALVLIACTASPEKSETAESLHQIYCGSCHLPPAPANIPKSIWAESVLPEMAARLGYRYNNYNPLAKNSMEENLYIRQSKTYPEQPVIDSATWQQIHDYIIARAPDVIPVDTLRSRRNAPLTQFEPTPISLDEKELALIVNIQFEPNSAQFIIGDALGSIFRWPASSDELPRFNSPVTAYHQTENGLFVTEIGYMNPSEKPLGTIYNVRGPAVDTLARNLHRPVYTKIEDLDEDGTDEILICEFGNLTGELSLLFSSAGSQYEKRTLLPLPGTIKVEIADMDGDGRKDIVVLASQGNEGIYTLYQENGLEFRLEQTIRMGSEYGSSWFELIDYNEDGHLDVVLANGDNADYSIFLKPYHGVRLFINDGENGFEEEWFYPIYGATRVLAEDYDLDGDLDFAVMAFFPDFNNTPEESFVLLENTGPAQYHFEPHTCEEALTGRWLVMENGDVDQDGDIDILLGSFAQFPGKQNQRATEYWRKEKVDLLLLKNSTK